MLPFFYAFKWSLLISLLFNFTTYLTDCLKDYSVYLYTIECSAFRFKIIYKHISVLYISLPVVIGCAIWQASSIKVGWTACNLAVSMNNKRSSSQFSPNTIVRHWDLSLKILIYSSEGFLAEFRVDLKIFSEGRFCPTSPHSIVLIWKTFTSSCTYLHMQQQANHVQKVKN